jgi:HK97 gp10 family phage protein
MHEGALMGVDIDGVQATLSNLGELPREIRQQVATKLNETAELTRTEAIQNITDEGAIGTSGMLRASVQVRSRADATDLRAVVEAGGSAQGGTVDYATFVEFGTKPHFPPVEAVTGEVEALDRWVDVKLNAEDTESAAFQVARKIAQVGTDAQPFMRPAAQEARDIFQKRMSSIDL